jgi:HD-GYP domain-containing protein (c-di-GMP phosphodiesterase class II)
MNMSDEFLEVLRISAQLHDVGKIGIEDHILKKPGALTEEEFEVMKTHTTKGANILRPVTQLAEMLPGIELHHEALDGRGYPYGLQGDQIPLLARIIAVADTFDALTTTRPYQHAHTPEQTLQIIKNLAGKRLDPKAVEALLAVYTRGDIKIQRFTIKRPIAPQSTQPPATPVTPGTTTPSEIATLERTRV